MTDPILQIQGLRKRYTKDGPEVVCDVSLEVHPGELLAMVGPSGCGKTTLLRLVAGFERLDAGTIRLGGETLAAQGPGQSVHVPAERRRVGIVFQDFALFPHLSVLANVMFGLRGPRADRRTRAIQTLQMLSMADYASRKPHTLSGGQQQRVALARTMATRPRFVLLDEPFSNLDPTLREAARADVKQLLHTAQTAAILVTHDRDEALSFGDRVAVMSCGRIEQIGPPEEVYSQPQTEFVARFLARSIVLEAQAQGHEIQTVLGSARLAKAAQGPLKIAIRPEQIQLSGPHNGAIPGVVQTRDFHGAMQTLVVEVGNQRYPVLAPATQVHPIGETVYLTIAGEVAPIGDGG